MKPIAELLKIAKEMLGHGSVSQFFSTREMSLPAKAKQPSNTRDELYEEANLAHEYMLDWLNRGQGLDRKLGLRRIDMSPDYMEGFFREFDKPGAVLVFPPMKGKERATEKVETEYEGDWSRLVDIVRATIAVERFSDLKKVADALMVGTELARRPEDSFVGQSAWGFRRLKINVVFPNGHIGEVQVHLKGIFKVCVQTHDLYKKAREIAAKAKEAGRDWLHSEELQTIRELTQYIFDQNEAAWQKYAPVTASSPKFAFMNFTAYYRYGGYPVEALVGKFPVMYAGNKQAVIYDLERFLMKATPIYKEEFTAMVEMMKGG